MKSLPLFAFALLASLSSLACGGAEGAADSEGDEGALERNNSGSGLDLKKYSFVNGILAVNESMKPLADALKAHGKRVGTTSYAGMTARELGLAEAGDRDDGGAFGVSCPDATQRGGDFNFDACMLLAVVKTEDAKPINAQAMTVTIRGKLARAIADGLPKTSPEGRVGATTYGVGKLECTVTRPGDEGVTCTTPALGVPQTFDALVHDETMEKASAERIIKAFFK